MSQLVVSCCCNVCLVSQLVMLLCCCCCAISLARQWLPPEKIEPLGASLEEDNSKIAMAGSSKRSVKEAYTRAKQWLRRRKKQQNSKTSKPSDADETEMSDLNIDDPSTDIYIDCNSV